MKSLPGAALLVVFLAGSAFAAETTTVDLRHRAYRTWSIQLPATQWFAIKDGVKIPHAGGDRFAIATEGGNLRIDTNGDGELDRTIKALVDADTRQATARVVFNAKAADGSPLRYAVRLRSDVTGWKWAPGGAMAGTITTKAGPIPVRLIDQNGNGRFNDIGTDAMIVGTGDTATFLSRTVFIDGALRQLEVSESGTRLTLKDFTGPTAKLDMTTSFSSEAMLLAAVIRSADGAHSFDFGTLDGPVQVPAGTYELITGTIGLGKQRVQISAGRMKAIVLAAGAEQTFDWGGPAKSEFGFLRRGAEVHFSPKAVWYYGVAGEEYVNWTPVGKSPEFTVKDGDTGAVLEVAILPGSC